MKNIFSKMLFSTSLITIKSLIALAIFVAISHYGIEQTQAGTGESGHSHDEESHSSKTIGEPGKLKDVRRTIKITMTDNAYRPKKFKVYKNETIRFVVSNKGEFVHEFNIGTKSMHQAHQVEMLAMTQSGALLVDRIDHSQMDHSGMTHDDPNSVLLEPNQEGEIIWKFSNKTEIEFACNIPGHYEDGMVGKIKF